MNIKYPFTAVVGQEDLKKALLLNLVNEKIGGVLINGEKGVAKSTIVRSLENLTGKKIVNMPLNISEDRLIGTINLEKTIESGELVFEEGLLKKAHKNILYVDEVNLLSDNIVDSLLDVSASKVNIIEREGISYSHESDFILIGTMNKESGDIRSEFLDRFALYIDVKGSREPKERVEILKRRLSFDNDPEAFCEIYRKDENKLSIDIGKSKDFLPKVKVSDEILSKIVEMSVKKGVKGHRADIIMEQTVKALAALELREEATEDDVNEAARFVYPHRATMNDDEEEEKEQEQEEEKDKDDDSKDDQSQEDNKNNEQNQNHNQDKENKEDSNKEQNENNSKDGSQGESRIFSVGQSFKVKNFAHEKDRIYRKSQGKRSKTKAQNKLGQYLYASSRVNDNDIAFDATIRAAAPYQKHRDKNGMALALRRSDLKGKVRQKKVSNLIVLVVDSSGSIGADARMVQVKGAILSLLKDSYVKRDKVALVSFRDKGAEVLLPPTNSVERAYKLLTEMKTGGKSPLNSGIRKGYEVIRNELRRDQSIMPMLVVISDGKGNVSMNPEVKPKDELELIAKGLREERIINSIIIDVEKKGMMSFGRAKKLAGDMGANYISLENLKSDDILSTIEKGRIKNE